MGGAGYLGGALTDILLKSKHDTLVYDLLLYEESYRKPVPFIYGDVRDKAKLKLYLDWADAVIWLVALVGDPACSLNEQAAKEINVASVEFLKENFHGKIIFMSTCSVYGSAEGELDENSGLNPLSLYADTKLAAEKILENSNALIFRLSTLYGIGDSFSRIRFDLVVNTLVMRAIYHGKVSVFGGRQYRPLLHVRDAAGAIYSCLEGECRGIYNLHSENITITEIAKRIKKFFPSLIIDMSDTKFQDNRNYRVSSKKAETDFNFSPKLRIEDAIAEFKTLLEQGRVKNSFISRFSNYLYLKSLLKEYNSPLGQSISMNI